MADEEQKSGGFALIRIDGKAVEKLIDVISKGIGKLYTPRAIRKEADAKAYEIVTIEKAKALAKANGLEIEQDTLDKMQERILFREINKQKNIDAVSLMAAKELENVNNISEESVDNDWTVRFFNIVENISDSDMQTLWARILAGEVKEPNSYSIHTLEFLRNMTKAEAELFTYCANYVIQNGANSFIFNKDKVLVQNGLCFEKILELNDLGLIQVHSNLELEFATSQKDVELIFCTGNKIIKAIKKAGSPVLKLPCYTLTKIGGELLKLLKPVAVEPYVKEFSLYLENTGITACYAQIVSFNDDKTITHTQPWMKYEK